jgi:hypothetical protein
MFHANHAQEDSMSVVYRAAQAYDVVQREVFKCSVKCSAGVR